MCICIVCVMCIRPPTTSPRKYLSFFCDETKPGHVQNVRVKVSIDLIALPKSRFATELSIRKKAINPFQADCKTVFSSFVTNFHVHF